MSNAINATIQKLVAVFGVGVTLTAVYKDGKATYGNGTTRLEVDLPEESKKVSGTYHVLVKSDTEVEETEVAIAPDQKEEKPAAKEAPKVKQSPAYGFGTSKPR